MINTNGKGPETYTWLCADRNCDTMDCFKSPANQQTVCKLWEVTEVSTFHDAAVADATKKILPSRTRPHRARPIPGCGARCRIRPRCSIESLQDRIATRP